MSNLSFPVPRYKIISSKVSECGLRSAISGKTAVVSGAGPAGLMAAILLKRSNRFDQVIVIEKRSEYSRTNMVEIKGATLLYLSKICMGTVEKLLQSNADIEKKITVFTDKAWQILPAWETVFKAIDSGLCIRNTNRFGESYQEISRNQYRLTESGFDQDFFNIDNVLSSPILELEHTLNLAAIEAGVLVFSGSSAKFQRNIIQPKKYWAELTLNLNQDGGRYDQRLILPHPALIIIAEGKNSSSRSLAGIDYFECPQSDLWYHGSFLANTSMGHSVISINSNHDGTKEMTSYIFNSRLNCFHGSVWLNEECDNETGRDILLNSVEKDMHAGKIKTESYKGLVAGSDSLLRIKPGIASTCTSGENLLLLGDAAGSGSPVAALGCSLALSVHMQALSDFIHSPGSEKDRLSYSKNLFNAVNYWHNRSLEILVDHNFLSEAYVSEKNRYLDKMFPERPLFGLTLSNP